MQMVDLELAIAKHAGEFHCRPRSGDTGATKTVRFRHAVGPPTPGEEPLPAFGRLAEFFDTFGSVTLYVDDNSGDAAVHISPPSEWLTLADDFSDWFSAMSDEEREDELPSWLDSCLVIGEMPGTGNYVLMGTTEDAVGQVFEFDHDGFEFEPKGSDLVEYVQHLLQLDSERLTHFAAHLTFRESSNATQWWIAEMRDNFGRVVATKY